MHNTVENDFFGFPKVKWIHLTGEMDKSVRFHVKIFSGFYIPNHSNRLIFDRVIQKGGSSFRDAVYIDLEQEFRAVWTCGFSDV